MKMKLMTTLDAAIIALALLASADGLAMNILAFGDFPIRYMTDEDLEIFKAAVTATLDKGADGTTVHWANPKTSAHGDLTPRLSVGHDARNCRDLEVANSAGGHDNRVVFTLCKEPDGDWKVEGP
jgi:surface antigen